MILPTTKNPRAPNGPSEIFFPPQERSCQGKMERRPHVSHRSRHRKHDRILDSQILRKCALRWKNSPNPIRPSAPCFPTVRKRRLSPRKRSDRVARARRPPGKTKRYAPANLSPAPNQVPGEIDFLQSHRPVDRRASRRHENDASRPVRISGRRENGGSSRHGRLEAEAYAPIVGAGPNSTALHYDKLSRKIEDGDIVVLDVARNTPATPRTSPAPSRERKIHRAPARNLRHRAGRAKSRHRRDQARHRPLPQRQKEPLSKSPTTTSTPTEGSTRQIARPIFHSRAGPRHRPRCPRPRRKPQAARIPAWSSPSSRAFTSPKKISACASKTTCSSRKPALQIAKQTPPRDPATIEKIMAEGAEERAHANH